MAVYTFSAGIGRSTVELQTPGWKQEIEKDVKDVVTCSDRQ